MDREKYYVNLHKHGISQEEIERNHGLTIYATEGEVSVLRDLFSKLHSADFTTFLRSHVPIKPYHNAQSNDEFDEVYTEVASYLYHLGDDETKEFITESGIIGNRPIKTDYTYPDPDHNGGKKA